MKNLFKTMRRVINKSDLNNFQKVDYTESVVHSSASDLTEGILFVFYNIVHRIINDIKFIPINQVYINKINCKFYSFN
jgi:hypothetical protein